MFPLGDSISHGLLWKCWGINKLNIWEGFFFSNSLVQKLPISDEWWASLCVDLDSVLTHLCIVTHLRVNVESYLYSCWVQDRVQFLLLGNVWYHLTYCWGLQRTNHLQWSLLPNFFFFWEERRVSLRRKNKNPNLFIIFCKFW